MVLFLLGSVPLFYGFLMSLILPPRRYGRELWFWFFRGILTFIPAYLLFLLLRKIVPLVFTPLGIYGYYFYHDAFLFGLLSVAGYVLIAVYFPRSGDRSVGEVLSYLSGFFTCVAAADFVRHYGEFDLYLMFLLPVLRLSTILVFAILLPRALDRRGEIPYHHIIAAVLFLALTAVVPLLYVIHLEWISILGAVVIAAGTGAFFWLNRDSV